MSTPFYSFISGHLFTSPDNSNSRLLEPLFLVPLKVRVIGSHLNCTYFLHFLSNPTERLPARAPDPPLACSKRSDSGERGELGKASEKTRGEGNPPYSLPFLGWGLLRGLRPSSAMVQNVSSLVLSLQMRTISG